MARRKKRGSFFSSFIIFIVFIIGLILVFNQPIKDFIVKYLQNNYQVNKLTAEQIKQNQKKEASFDFSDVQTLDMEGVIKAGLDSKNLSQLGGIAIPSINVNLPIFKGTSDTALCAGAGTMKPDQEMGKGNYALASHRSYTEDLLFAPLKNIKIDANIYLTDLEYIYTYKVFRKEYISPRDVDVIENHGDKIEVTLITCNYSGSQRLLVQGELTAKTPIKEANKEMVGAFKLKKKTII